MSIIGSNILAGASGQGGGASYTIENSLRFRSSASAYLSRTFGTPTENKKWTYSAWVKRGSLGVHDPLLGVYLGGSDFFLLAFAPDNKLFFYYINGATDYGKTTTAVYRDPSAWYHFTFVYDSTDATPADRMRLYVNGERVQSFSADYGNLPLNAGSYVNGASPHTIGYRADTGAFFDGYMAEVNFIDGQALDPSSFGEYNEDTGVWQPVAYEGTYGNNGFYLPFSDATNTTTLVADSSGNGNDWTPNGISLTSGATYDSMTDTPTIYADGGNYAVLNPAIRQYSTVDFASEGNLKYQVGANGGATDVIFATMPMTSGKWFAEVQIVTTATGQWIGVCSNVTAAGLGLYGAGVRNPGYAYRVSTGNKCNNSNTGTAYAASSTTGDIIGIAMDADAGSITFYKNGVSLGVAFTGMTNSGGGWLFGAASDPNGSFRFNFGQRPFAYTPPTGFLPLHTGNLPDSTIVDGSTAFNVDTYAGTGATNARTIGFQPDFVWIKARTNAYWHKLFDSVRGANKPLVSNDTTSELTETTGLMSFDSDGFTLGTSADSTVNNSGSGQTFVAWNWKAGGAAVTNELGSITSQVSANTTAGFSIVTYTADGVATATIGHGLGATPDMIITFGRTGGSTNHAVYHSALTNASSSIIWLDSPLGAATNAGYWNATAPTATVFSGGASGNYVNNTGWTMVAYCFAEVEGYSKFGTYTGNGVADGVFVHLGFKPKFVLHKRSDSSGDWYIWDSEREPDNYKRLAIWPNYPNSEYNYAGTQVWDFVSNGMKARTNSAVNNTGSATYIYMAFAENPFKNSLAG